MLRAAVEIDERTGSFANARELEKATGLDSETVQRALRSLSRGNYFGEFPRDFDGMISVVGAPTETAFRTVGKWPSPETQLERLIAALQTAADDDSRPDEERSRFRQAATWLGTTASAIAIGALGGAGGNILTG